MRNSKIVLIGFGLLLMGSLAISLDSGKVQAASIVGSPHDLSGEGYGTTQICIFCHTPHNAKTEASAPLWNHGDTTATYTLYSSPTFTATGISQPGSNSKACLSCHDGTIAIDAYGSETGSNFMSGDALLDINLANDHPISFTYDGALAAADGGLVVPSSSSEVVTGIPLFYSKMECASCHGVHDNAHGNFLRFDNTGSALCLKCHLK
jgi:predicted CXXCH cytochrome family protein